MSAADGSKLKSFLEGIEPQGIEKIIAERTRREEAVAAEGRSEGLPIAERALEKLASGRQLTPDEQFGIEAIIIPDKRPVIDIRNGRYAVTHALWRHYETDASLRSNIETAIRSIGRIELPGHPSFPYGGTGFVVGDGLLMTNRHVAQIFARGLGTRHLGFIDGLAAGLDLVREVGSPAQGQVLRVTRVVMIHPYWDMALLAVEGLERPALRLAVDEIPADRDVAAIGYPAFDPRNDAGVQREVFRNIFNVKRLQPGKLRPRRDTVSFGKTVSAVTHDSSTLGGNSGSAVIDVTTGHMVALHFGGLYLDANFAVPAAELARDGRVVDARVTFAGTARGGTPAWERYWREADGEEQQAGSVAGPPARGATVGLTSPLPGSEVKVTVPVEIVVRVGTPQLGTAVQVVTGRAADAAAVERPVEPFRNTDYSARPGYNATFLGPRIEMPQPVDVAVAARMRGGGHVVPYYNFSAIVHARRRLTLITASNVTAEAALKKPEAGRDYSRKGLSGLGRNDQEKWYLDPRLEPTDQLPDRFFTRDRGAFDKGHVVRREDVAWGLSYELIRFANGDTFHVTNCSPQVAGFNRSRDGADNWGDLENFVLAQAGTERLALFAGPVLADDDPVFVGVDDDGPVRVKVPRRYWKVVVANAVGGPQTFAFLLEQDLSGVPVEFVVDEAWQRKLVPLATIERLAAIQFPPTVRAADQHGLESARRLAQASGVTVAA